MSVQHFTLGETTPLIHSTYLSTITRGDDRVHEHPGAYTVHAENSPLTFKLFHGRKDPSESMDDWGFDGPHFDCLSLAHDTDRILLQNASPQSIELANRLGLTTTHDTITLLYEADLVVVPLFMGAPAYFGDHTIQKN